MIKMRLIILLLTLTAITNAQTFNIKEYGAADNKEINSTKAIQKAINDCIENGGGTVFFPAGEYLSSTVVLGNNVELMLGNGAIWYMSNQPEEYNITASIEDTGGGDTPVFIYAHNARNISISGNGLILGQPEYYEEPLGNYDFIDEDYQTAIEAGLKPMASRWKKPNVIPIFLSECDNVSIEDITIKDAPFWNIHLHWCNQVQIRGVELYSKLGIAGNSDGIDIDGCKNVTISDCIISTADDAICLKTTKSKDGFRSCENVTVTNCVLESSSCALKLGTESYGDFRHILFNNCTIRKTNRALGIFIRDGGIAENIIFSNITAECIRYQVGWWGSADLMRFVVLKRNKDSKVGEIKNVLVKNIWANVEGTSRIQGFSDNQRISNILLSEIHVLMRTENVPDKRATHAFEFANINDLRITGLTVNWAEVPVRNEKSAIHIKDCNEIYLDGFFENEPGFNDQRKSILLERVNNGTFQNLWPNQQRKPSQQISTSNCNNIKIPAQK
jgi:polygalacturonase